MVLLNRKAATAAVVVLALTLVGMLPTAAVADETDIVDTVTTAHPRLLVTADGFDDAADRIDSNPQLEAWFDTVKATGDALLTQGPYSYSGAGALLDISRGVLSRVYTLGMLYQITDDDAYAARLWTELNAVSQFSNWHTAQFLDTAEMAHAVAIGYDWTYDYLTESQRQQLRTALVDKALTPALNLYRNDATWTVRTDNWNIVCNAGMAMAALAIAHDEPALSEEILASGLASVPLAFHQYEPDGGYIEGVSYWGYATKYLADYAQSFITATGDDQGLLDAPGFSETALFPVYLAGPSGQSVNFSDSGPELQQIPETALFGALYNDPIAQWWALEGTKIASPSAVSVLFGDPDSAESPVDADLPLDHTFAGTEISTMRSGWEQRDAVFASLKGGTPGGHADLDHGSFVMDALGVRWAKELGVEDYNLPGYFDVGAEGGRWDYYRKRAEGQNTLSINPGTGPDQDPLGETSIVRTGSAIDEAFSIADLTGARSTEVTSWRRGVKLFDDRQRVLVQDEISTAGEVDAWWSMHTDATIDISPDGRTAILQLDGEQMFARILSPAAATFQDLEAAPLWVSPQPAQTSNAPTHKLAIRVATESTVTVAVELTPLRDGVAVPTAPTVVPLDDWTVGTADPALLASLTVDGLDTFTPETLSYDVPATTSSVAPTVSAAGAPGTNLDIEQADAVPGVATVEVSGAGLATTTYHLYFGPDAEGAVEGSIAVSAVTASRTDAGRPSNTVDGIRNTRWASQTTGAWIQYDLGTAQDVAAVSIAWRDVANRNFSYQIETSPDGTTWTTAATSTTSGGDADGWQHDSFSSVTVRYVRIVVGGSTLSALSTIDEVRILDHAAAPRNRELELGSVDLGALPATLDLGSSIPIVATPRLTDNSATTATVQVGVDDDTVAELSGGSLTAVAVGFVTVWATAESDTGRLVHIAHTIEVVDPEHRVFSATADTFVRDGAYANDNYGGAATLLAKKASVGFQRQAYLDFGVLPVPGQNIQSAILHLHARVNDAGQPATALQVRETGAFDESTLTYGTSTAPGAVIGSAAVDPAPAEWVDVDVTTYAVSRTLAGQPLTLAVVEEIARENGYGVLIDSSETGDPDLRPYLEVTLGNDVSAITAAITAAQAVDPAVYTTNSLGTLATALAAAQAVLADEEATQQDIDAAAATLQAAMTALVERPVPLITVGAYGDTFVRDGSYSNQNSGSSSTLLAKRANTGFLRQAYLAFDLSTIPSDRVLSASLVMTAWVNENTGGGTSTSVDVSASGSFTESTLTYATIPTTGGLIGTVAVPSLSPTAVSLDVTSWVTAGAGGVSSLVLTEHTTLTNGWGAVIASRESSDSSRRPVLLVQLRADTVALDLAITSASALVASDYTAATWGPVASALSSAIAVADDDQSTQAAVDGALAALDTAVAGLVPVGEPRLTNTVESTCVDGQAAVSASGTNTDATKLDVRFTALGQTEKHWSVLVGSSVNSTFVSSGASLAAGNVRVAAYKWVNERGFYVARDVPYSAIQCG